MEYEKFEGKYVPEFQSKELLQAAVFTKAFGNLATCSYCNCVGLKCSDCLLNDRDCCIAYLKQHHECLENYLKDIIKTSKGEKTMKNDFPKLSPGMAITFTTNNKLGFMVSETQIVYVYPRNSCSVIIDGWDRLGDREYDVPYSRIKDIYASTDTDNETKELIKTLTPYELADMVEAVDKGKDPADLDGVKLIWSRQEHKEMTVDEIEKELGYKIKIVGEEK